MVEAERAGEEAGEDGLEGDVDLDVEFGEVVVETRRFEFEG